MELKDLILKSDNSSCSAAEILTELSPETKVEFFDTVSRWVGTGYTNEIYRVIGADSAVVVQRNNHSQYDGFYDSVYVDENFFTARRNYGRACGEASRRLSLPFPVVLAIGPELADEYKAAVDAIKRWPNRHLYHELTSCGIDRRKEAIHTVLGQMSDELYAKIQKSGQDHSYRIASHLARKVAPWKKG